MHLIDWFLRLYSYLTLRMIAIAFCVSDLRMYAGAVPHLLHLLSSKKSRTVDQAVWALGNIAGKHVNSVSSLSCFTTWITYSVHIYITHVCTYVHTYVCRSVQWDRKQEVLHYLCTYDTWQCTCVLVSTMPCMSVSLQLCTPTFWIAPHRRWSWTERHGHPCRDHSKPATAHSIRIAREHWCTFVILMSVRWSAGECVSLLCYQLCSQLVSCACNVCEMSCLREHA